MLRKWIGFIVMLAFVVSTMPSLSHAAMPEMGRKTIKVEAAKKHPCHEEAEKVQATNTASAEPCHGKKSCCDGTNCKCLGNACNGAAKVLGQASIDWPHPLAREVFPVSQDRVAFSLSDRIKRPPRS